jgi:hypothetical protein
MADKGDFSGLPSFENYRDADAPPEKPDPPPRLYPLIDEYTSRRPKD